MKCIAKTVWVVILVALLGGCESPGGGYDSQGTGVAIITAPIWAPILFTYKAIKEAQEEEKKRRHEKHLEYLRAVHCEDEEAAKIQYLLGKDYELGRGIEKQTHKAVFWYGLSMKYGESVRKEWETVKNSFDKLSKQLTPDELTEVQKQIAEWKADPSKCELPERSTSSQK